MQHTHGFDMIPPLQPTRINRALYKTFIETLLARYERRPATQIDRAHAHAQTQKRSLHCRTRSQGVAQIVPAPHGAYILFLTSNLPVIPYNPSLCHCFVQFSCSVSTNIDAASTSLARDVYELARSIFGKRVSWWSNTPDGTQAPGFWEQTYVDDMHRYMMKALESGWVDIEGKRKSLFELEREEEEEDKPPPVPPKTNGDGMGVVAAAHRRTDSGVYVTSPPYKCDPQPPSTQMITDDTASGGEALVSRRKDGPGRGNCLRNAWSKCILALWRQKRWGETDTVQNNP